MQKWNSDYKTRTLECRHLVIILNILEELNYCVLCESNYKGINSLS